MSAYRQSIASFANVFDSFLQLVQSLQIVDSQQFLQLLHMYIDYALTYWLFHRTSHLLKIHTNHGPMEDEKQSIDNEIESLVKHYLLRLLLEYHKFQVVVLRETSISYSKLRV